MYVCRIWEVEVKAREKVMSRCSPAPVARPPPTSTRQTSTPPWPLTLRWGGRGEGRGEDVEQGGGVREGVVRVLWTRERDTFRSGWARLDCFPARRGLRPRRRDGGGAWSGEGGSLGPYSEIGDISDGEDDVGAFCYAGNFPMSDNDQGETSQAGNFRFAVESLREFERDGNYSGKITDWFLNEWNCFEQCILEEFIVAIIILANVDFVIRIQLKLLEMNTTYFVINLTIRFVIRIFVLHIQKQYCICIFSEIIFILLILVNGYYYDYLTSTG